MSRAVAEGRRKRRHMSLLVSGGAIILIIVLLALEQVALLYLLATLGVAVLLFVVAFADLHGAIQETVQAAPGDDAAAIADRTARATPVANTFASNAPRTAKRRQRR
jgi:hypothetical protein